MMIFPFDPIQRSKDIESLVMHGDKRRYYRFRFAKFYGGIGTADATGCNLLCAYCWNYSRNLNHSKAGELFSPIEVAEKLQAISEKQRCNQFRISGAEPILGRSSAQHLSEVIRLVGGQFILETNGIAIGHDPALLDLLKPLNCHIRLTIKGEDPDSFQKVTGAFREAFTYQLQAVEAIRKARISMSVAVMAQFVDPGKLPIPVDEVEDLIVYQSTERILQNRGF
ncbi:7-carboxy-7-deazaguanine synthase [uncultured archaeon]|nr:7-carboxy-7-deazaguanine synthase [uncultured archaeon]